MDAKQKLDKLLTYFGTNKNQLGTATGKRQTFYDIAKGQIKSFSPELVSAIKNVYPEINENWFLFDEGDMLKKRASPFDEPYTPEPKPDKKSEDLKQLEKIKSQNGKTTEIYTIFKEKRELEELKKISFK